MCLQIYLGFRIYIINHFDYWDLRKPTPWQVKNFPSQPVVNHPWIDPSASSRLKKHPLFSHNGSSLKWRTLCSNSTLTSVLCNSIHSNLNIFSWRQFCELWGSPKHSFHIKTDFNVTNAVADHHQPIKKLGKFWCTSLCCTCLLW